MEFRVVSNYRPAGDQPVAISALGKILKNTAGKAVLMGVTGSGKTMTMACVIEQVRRPVIVITHNKTLAAQLYREFKDYFPDNAVEYFVSYYDYYQPEAYIPVSDTFIEKDAAINDEIEMLRLRTTSSLLEREDVIVVASVSCIYGLGSPEDYSESVLLLQKGQNISREETITRLVRMLYERNDTELQRGKFRARGDVLEVFPAYTQDILRLDFFGDQLENICKIDRITGKKKEEFEKTAIYPSKHFITSPPKLMEAIGEIKKELAERVEYFRSIHKPLEAERIQQRTLYDIEMLREMGYCSGIENYSRHLTQRAPGSRAACLLDYFPENFLIIIDESHVTIPQIGGMYAGDRSRKETLVEFGFRLPSALDNRPLNFGEFETFSKNILYVSATPADYELNLCSEVIPQIIRPTGLLDPVVEIRKTEGQIDDLAMEIQKRAKKNQRVLITTLTKKMAEDLTDYYANIGVRIRYMHSEIVALERLEIIRDLRKGEFDVLVGINLLREGLDLPEVSLVAILDADKEGFLRSRRSLIQTMGRAARNSEGMAILYADKITDSMKAAMDETARRRKIQEEYNITHNVTPTTIEKNVVDIIDRVKKEEEQETGLYDDVLKTYHPQNYRTKKEWQEKLKAAMIASAEELDFEKAALIRDLLFSGQEKDVDFD